MFKEKIKTIRYESNFKKDNYSKMAQFNCGNDDINTLFRNKLSKLHATTYIFMDNETNKIVAFVSFCASSIQIHEKGLYSFPAVELKLFGVDKDYQHKSITLGDVELKYSELIFQWFVTYIIQEIKPRINVEYIVLYSVPTINTRKFYEKMGFADMNANYKLHDSDFSCGCIPMYLNL
jgi:DNA polymerase III epsilon subunit-like protein